MKQVTFLICAFLVLFQVCSTVCDDIDTSTTVDENIITVKIEDLLSAAGSLDDFNGRWDGFPAVEKHEIDRSILKELYARYIERFMENPKEFPQVTMD